MRKWREYPTSGGLSRVADLACFGGGCPFQHCSSEVVVCVWRVRTLIVHKLDLGVNPDCYQDNDIVLSNLKLERRLVYWFRRNDHRTMSGVVSSQWESQVTMSLIPFDAYRPKIYKYENGWNDSQHTSSPLYFIFNENLSPLDSLKPNPIHSPVFTPIISHGRIQWLLPPYGHTSCPSIYWTSFRKRGPVYGSPCRCWAWRSHCCNRVMYHCLISLCVSSVLE